MLEIHLVSQLRLTQPDVQALAYQMEKERLGLGYQRSEDGKDWGTFV